MVGGLVPSMSTMGAAILSSGTDVRATAILGMEVPGQLPGILSLGLRRAILMSRSDVRA